jgi:hypothetical protein
MFCWGNASRGSPSPFLALNVFALMTAMGLQMPLISDHVLSVYPTNPTSNHLTACQCHPTSNGFHPTAKFSVRMPHQILPGLCYCVSYCFSSFLQLLRRRSHVRIVLGRPVYSNSLNNIEHKKPASVDNPTRFELAK